MVSHTSFQASGVPGRPDSRGGSPLWQKCIDLLLLLIFLLFFARLLLILFGNWQPDLENRFAENAETSLPPVDIDRLQNSSLFGTRSAESAGNDAGIAGAPVNSPPATGDTRLSLRLEGVVVGNPPESGFAMIAGNGATGTYRLGDRLPAAGRVVLNGIYPDRVILENSGTMETLWLYDQARERGQATVPASGQSRAVRELEQITQESYNPVALVNEYRERFANNAAGSGFLTLSEIVKISPAYENSQLLGYRVTPGEHLKEFVRLGFKTNDIVNRINGIELNDISNLPLLFEEMTTAADITLSLLREGSPMELQLSLEGLAKTD